MKTLPKYALFIIIICSPLYTVARAGVIPIDTMVGNLMSIDEFSINPQQTNYVINSYPRFIFNLVISTNSLATDFFMNSPVIIDAYTVVAFTSADWDARNIRLPHQMLKTTTTDILPAFDESIFDAGSFDELFGTHDDSAFMISLTCPGSCLEFGEVFHPLMDFTVTGVNPSSEFVAFGELGQVIDRSFSSVPEPSTVFLTIVGLLGFRVPRRYHINN